MKKKLIKQHGELASVEYKQLMDSIGFLSGADFEHCLSMDEFRAGAIRGQKAFRFSKKGKQK